MATQGPLPFNGRRNAEKGLQQSSKQRKDVSTLKPRKGVESAARTFALRARLNAAAWASAAAMPPARLRLHRALRAALQFAV